MNRETPQLTTYEQFVCEWFEKVRDYQVDKGRTFNLTTAEFATVIAPHQRRTIIKHLNNGTMSDFMKHRLYAYVMSWVSKEAFIAGVMDKSTAKVMTRKASEIMCGIKKGDKQSETAKAKIGAAKRGKTQKAKHVEKRANAQRGVKRGPPSEAHKEAQRVAARARWAAKREGAAL